MRTPALVALLAVLVSGAATADEPSAATRERTAALSPAVPPGVRDRQRPVFGLRLQETRLAASTLTGAPLGARTVLEVPFVQHNDDPLDDSGAKMLLGKGLIVGIVVGAIVAVSVIGDNDDGDGGGY